MLILGMALGLTNFLVDAGIPDQAIDWVQSYIQSPQAFFVGRGMFYRISGRAYGNLRCARGACTFDASPGNELWHPPCPLWDCVSCHLRDGFLVPTCRDESLLCKCGF